jgi:hypothetical protein
MSMLRVLLLTGACFVVAACSGSSDDGNQGSQSGGSGAGAQGGAASGNGGKGGTTNASGTSGTAGQGGTSGELGSGANCAATGCDSGDSCVVPCCTPPGSCTPEPSYCTDTPPPGCPQGIAICRLRCGSETGGAGSVAGSGGMASGAGSGGATNPAAGSSSTSDGGEAGGHGSDLDDTTLLEQARGSYAAWEKRTENPQAISAEIFALCRGPTQAEEDFVASEHGDMLYLLDWLDPGAAAVFTAASSGPFPVGATIVKEKLVLESGGYMLHALGLMLKREPGFDPAHGDWQFGYWNAADGMIAGASENEHCGNCHAGSSTDFVFMDASWHAGELH